MKRSGRENSRMRNKKKLIRRKKGKRKVNLHEEEKKHYPEVKQNIFGTDSPQSCEMTEVVKYQLQITLVKGTLVFM